MTAKAEPTIADIRRLVVVAILAVGVALVGLVALYLVREDAAEDLRQQRAVTAEQDRIDRQREVCLIIDRSFESYTRKLITASNRDGEPADQAAIDAFTADVQNLVNECLESE